MPVSLFPLLVGASVVSAAPSTLDSLGGLSFTERSSVRLAASDCNGEERTLLRIIWSCLSTLFICTWVAVHPNIPPLNSARWGALQERIYLVLVGVISPEIVVMLAARQYYGAKRIASEFKDDGIAFTETQAHFSQMGGFMLFCHTRPIGIVDSHNLFRIIARLDFKYDLSFRCKSKDVSFRLPTDQELWDRSKGDWISKALGFFQVLWFTLQCTSRWVNGLVVTRLELVTFALSVLNGIIYFLWWNKPVDVRFPLPVLWAPDDSKHTWEEFEILDLSVLTVRRPSPEDPWWKAPAYVWINIWSLVNYFDGQYSHKPTDGATRRFIACTELGSGGMQLQVVAISCWSAMIFGATHLIAWQSSFLTTSEQVIWRICAILTTAAPLIPLVWRFYWQLDYSEAIRGRSSGWHRRMTLTLLKRATYFLVPVYMLARVGLLGVAISSLRTPAKGIFLDLEWSSYIPHF